ncbi:MAG: hypothetical protein J5819_02830, partial [Eubacterium sp.]|nr:hypothetical protein [Eubacterium sp.]
IGSVLAALDAEDYSLPCTIEKKTPIGVKLVFSKYKDKNGGVVWSVDLVYQTTTQLKEMPLLTFENHPAIYSVSLKGLTKNADGLYEGNVLEERFDKAIAAFDDIIKAYPKQLAA